MEILSAHHISKQFAHHKALDDVSIHVPQNAIFGLLGPNGAGKTTLIRIINQIFAPDSGEVIFGGRPLQPSDIYRIGYLPEERGLYKKMKVGEMAIYLAMLKGLSRHDATLRIKEWFKKFEIESWWNRKVEELSKGMQQKVQFLVTVIHEPELLIFDEPFSGFDPINVNILKEEILELKRKGSTIIFSTHNMGSVEELCDTIALINNSKKMVEGAVWDIRNRFKQNLFHITYEISETDLKTILPESFQLIDHFQKNYAHHATIQLPTGISSNALLQHILPHLHLLSFNEIIPSMNDVFIQVVTQQKSNSPTGSIGL